jgi:hypothetical protein
LSGLALLPVLASSGSRPGAGQVMAVPGQVVGPAASMTEITHDTGRGFLWLGYNTATAGVPNLRTASPSTLAPLVPTILTDEMDGGGPGGADIDGPVDGLGMLSNGNLLCSDTSGDGTRFSDTLFEVDPTGPTLTSFWYTNGSACLSCRPNTNTNLPQRDLWAVGALTASRASLGTGPIFVTRALNNRGTTVLTRISLVPGTPGTWQLIQDVPTPCGSPATGISFDPDQAAQNGLDNVYWFVSAGNHQLYECTWDALRRRFEINQTLPAPFFAGPATSNRVDSSVAARLGTASPHLIVLGEGSTTAASNVLVEVDAGTGGTDTPRQEYGLFHSTFSTNLYNPTDPVVFNEEVQLFRAGRTGNTSEWTTQQASLMVFPTASSTILSDVDALALDPDFAGTEPTFFDMFWSDRVDQPTAVGGPILDGDIVRIRRDCSLEFLIREAEIRSVLGITTAAFNTDGLAILPNRDLLVSFSDSSLATTSPNFPGGVILNGDVLVIPAARAPNTGYWAYREAEFGTFIGNAIGGPAFGYADLDGIEIDPQGNLTRPNPNQPATTRPDVIFTTDYTVLNGTPSGYRLNHVFSTRSTGGPDGLIIRDARDFGYGVIAGLAAGIRIDALALLPRDTTITPITDVFVQPVPSQPGQQILRLIARNLTPGDLNVFIVGLERLCPTLDVRPYGFRGYPLQVVPYLFLPISADDNGLAEMTFQFPTGIGTTFWVQSCSSESIRLGTLARLTLL